MKKVLDSTMGVVCATLENLRRGESGKILGIFGDSDSVVRLHALGFLPGRLVRHCHTAPLGDPVAYEIDSQKISMRRADASLVEIEKVVL